MESKMINPTTPHDETECKNVLQNLTHSEIVGISDDDLIDHILQGCDGNEVLERLAEILDDGPDLDPDPNSILVDSAVDDPLGQTEGLGTDPDPSSGGAAASPKREAAEADNTDDFLCHNSIR